MIPISAKCSVCEKSEEDLKGRIFDEMGQCYDSDRRIPVALYCWDHYWKNVVGYDGANPDPFLSQLDE